MRRWPRVEGRDGGRRLDPVLQAQSRPTGARQDGDAPLFATALALATGALTHGNVSNIAPHRPASDIGGASTTARTPPLRSAWFGSRAPGRGSGRPAAATSLKGRARSPSPHAEGHGVGGRLRSGAGVHTNARRRRAKPREDRGSRPGGIKYIRSYFNCSGRGGGGFPGSGWPALRGGGAERGPTEVAVSSFLLSAAVCGIIPGADWLCNQALGDCEGHGCCGRQQALEERP